MSVKFEQIPFFYPRGCAAPLREITPIATLERFVVYCSSELIISGSAPGRGPEGTGNCSRCYGKLQTTALAAISVKAVIAAGAVNRGVRGRQAQMDAPDAAHT